MDELVLQHQRRRPNDLRLARVLDHRHEVVAALAHLREATEERRSRHRTDRGQLAEELQKAAVEVALAQRPHQQPRLARLGGRDGGPEGGRALREVETLEQRWVVQVQVTLFNRKNVC